MALLTGSILRGTDPQNTSVLGSFVDLIIYSWELVRVSNGHKLNYNSLENFQSQSSCAPCVLAYVDFSSVLCVLGRVGCLQGQLGRPRIMWNSPRASG